MPVVTPVAKRVDTDAFVVGVDHERRAKGLRALGLESPALDRILKDKAVSLAPKATRTVWTDAGWVVLVVLGDPKALTQEKLGALTSAGARAAAGAGAKRALCTFLADVGARADRAQAVAQGFILGSLDFDQYKSKKDDKKEGKNEGRLEELQVLVPGGKAALRKAVTEGALVAEAVNDARLMANTPANIATPEWLAKEAQRRGREHGFKVSVMGRSELRRRGFNALCGVAQGSTNEERLITMDYRPAKARKTLVVVGKGVCFDSGGISLKPGQGMWDMKYDKCGACNVIALMTTLKRLGVKHRVVGIVAAVENMPSGTAQRPGDIVTAKDGTTIEVLNTDAEGRLILADALAHGRTFEPAWMCDMATLTGACEIAVGPTYVAAMGRPDSLVRSFVDAARRAGDKAWPLPQGEEYDEANKGTYADLQNISLTNKAGTCIGGSFVGHFAKDTPFVHLDIASKAWTGGVDAFKKGPTGAGLRIVLQRIRQER